MRCVPDVHLCMLRDGAAFLGGLIPHADVWATPEFLHVLDDWELHDGRPELLREALGEGYSDEGVRDALRHWLRLRDETGNRGGRLYCVRDSLRESNLPPGADDTLVSRWETMAEALDSRLTITSPGGALIDAHKRDTAALAATIQGAFVLTVRMPAERTSLGSRPRPAPEPKQSAAPSLCQHLESWGVPCRRVGIDDDLVALERSLLLHLLVEAGLSGFLWNGLPLSVVHLIAPGAFGVSPGRDGPAGAAELDYFSSGEPRPVKSPWEAARAFWYDLDSGDHHAG
jgi:hypothetical protein